MYIITVYSLRVKKQAQFILKIATVQEILQKKREIALVNLSVRRVSTHLKFVLPPLYAPFSRSLAAENPDMQYAFGAFLLEVRRALETASFFVPGRQKKRFLRSAFFNKSNSLLWICKIPFGRRLIDLPFCADRKFHAPKGFFRICRKVNIIRKSLAYNSFAAMIILYYSHYSPLPVANKSALQKRGRRER